MDKSIGALLEDIEKYSISGITDLFTEEDCAKIKRYINAVEYVSNINMEDIDSTWKEGYEIFRYISHFVVHHNIDYYRDYEERKNKDKPVLTNIFRIAPFYYAEWPDSNDDVKIISVSAVEKRKDQATEMLERIIKQYTKLKENRDEDIIIEMMKYISIMSWEWLWRWEQAKADLYRSEFFSSDNSNEKALKSGIEDNGVACYVNMLDKIVDQLNSTDTSLFNLRSYTKSPQVALYKYLNYMSPIESNEALFFVSEDNGEFKVNILEDEFLKRYGDTSNVVMISYVKNAKLNFINDSLNGKDFDFYSVFDSIEQDTEKNLKFFCVDVLDNSNDGGSEKGLFNEYCMGMRYDYDRFYRKKRRKEEIKGIQSFIDPKGDEEINVYGNIYERIDITSEHSILDKSDIRENVEYVFHLTGLEVMGLYYKCWEYRHQSNEVSLPYFNVGPYRHEIHVQYNDGVGIKAKWDKEETASSLTIISKNKDPYFYSFVEKNEPLRKKCGIALGEEMIRFCKEKCASWKVELLSSIINDRAERDKFVGKHFDDKNSGDDSIMKLCRYIFPYYGNVTE